MTVTFEQAGAAAQAAGFSGEDVVTIVAIGFAESRGNETIVGDGGNSYGFTQIHWPSWGQRLQSQGIAANPNALKTLSTNLRAAKYVKDNGSRGFGEWTQYRNGAYRQYETDARLAIFGLGEKGSVDIPNPLDVVDDVAGAISRGVDLVAAGAKWFGDPRNWVRIVQVVGGGFVVIAGLSLILQETQVGQSLVSAGKQAATKGAVK